MYEIAGAAGVDPSDFSLRQLVYMADGRNKAERNNIGWVMGQMFGGGGEKRALKENQERVTPEEFKALMTRPK